MSATVVCDVPIQAGIEKVCKAEFTIAGMLLVIDGLPLGAEIPDSFSVEIEDTSFWVSREGDEHMVSEDDRDAFTTMASG